jgi:hypothetical protein
MESHMSFTGLPIFDETVQLTNVWLNEMGELDWKYKKRAYRVLRATLHALRDRTLAAVSMSSAIKTSRQSHGPSTA